MPIENDDMDDLELDPSTSETTLDDAADPQGDAAAANSSDANDETSEATALSIVRDVVGDRAAGAADAASSADGSGGEGPDADGQTSERDAEDYSDVPFNKHPRFQQVVKERREFKVDAERYQNVQNFLDDNGLSAEEAADGLVIMALMKTEPVKAWQQLRPMVQKLLVAAGEVLPEDLAARVEKGELTQDAAMEISRANAAVASVNAKTSFAQQRAQRKQEASQATELTSTAQTWVEDRQKKDPNFEAKSPLLQREIAFLQRQEGRPDTVEGVKDQLKRAYAAVNAAFKAPAPAPAPAARPAAPAAQKPAAKPAIKPITGGTVSGNARQAPVLTLDIVRANRRQSA